MAVKPVVKAKDAVARTQEIIVHHYYDDCENQERLPIEDEDVPEPEEVDEL